MKKFFAALVLICAFNASATVPKFYSVKCKHFAASQVLDTLDFDFHSIEGQWSKDVKVTVSSDEAFMPNGERVGKIRSDVRNHYVPDEAEIYFEGCVNCDFDGVKVRFTHDDDLGKLAIMEYVSDGPVFTQILQCKHSH